MKPFFLCFPVLVFSQMRLGVFYMPESWQLQDLFSIIYGLVQAL